MTKFEFDLTVCARTALCHFEHPELFEEGGDGLPFVLPDAPQDELSEEQAREVTMLCPTGALRLAAAGEEA